MTHMRSSTKDPIIKAFLKRAVNLSCGFFGARENHSFKTKYRIVNQLPHSYSIFKHFPDIRHAITLDNNTDYFLLETQIKQKRPYSLKMTQSALPMFLTIIEFGKLRLVQLIHFIQQHAMTNAFRLLYCNVDNMVYALANGGHLEDSIHSSLMKQFKDKACHYFVIDDVKGTLMQPGLGQLKWTRQPHDKWKFISIRTQHYCVLVTSHQDGTSDICKTAGWSPMPGKQAYQLAKDILQGNPASITQMRRINKRANIECRQVELQFN